MSIFPTSSDRRCGEGGKRRAQDDRKRLLGALITALVCLAAIPAAGHAQQLLTQAEALRLAFPGASTIERRTAFLDERQLAAARAAAGSGIAVDQAVVTYYVGVANGRPLGVAYFDAHRVRTMREVVMVVVSPRATVERIEILSFAEPPEYRAPDGWLDQFDGGALSPELSLRGRIRNITGATLTSRAITDAVRRTLSIHRVITPLAGPGTAPSP